MHPIRPVPITAPGFLPPASPGLRRTNHPTTSTQKPHSSRPHQLPSGAAPPTDVASPQSRCPDAAPLLRRPSFLTRRTLPATSIYSRRARQPRISDPAHLPTIGDAAPYPASLLPPDAAPPSPARRTTLPSPLPPQIRPQPRRRTALPAPHPLPVPHDATSLSSSRPHHPPNGATETGAASSSLPSTAIFSSQF